MEKQLNGGKPAILILGAGVMQGPAIRIAKEMGLQTIAADANPLAVCVNLADRFEKVDLKDKEGMEILARSLKSSSSESGGLAGIMTAGTDFSATVAWVAEKLKLPGISYETALDASDKERMRRRFKAAGVPSPAFIVLDSPPAEDFTLPFSWPVVVKPVDNMGARGCCKVENNAGLITAVGEALGFSRSGRVIVEEYMDGPEYSIDALVYQGEITVCGIADRHIFFPPFFIEMGHTIPSSADTATIGLVLDTFCRGVQALGIDYGAAKGDVKLSSKGPMIGEIAARLSGGYMSGWTYPYSSGVLPTKGAIEIALGKKPSCLEKKWNWTCAERAFISIPGRVFSFCGLEQAKAMPYVKDIFVSVETGTTVKFPENNVTKCGNVISAASNREDAVFSAESAARSILIRLEAPNKATEAFLGVKPSAQKGKFPPDAFSLDERLLSILGSIPDLTKEDLLNLKLFEFKMEEIYIYPFKKFIDLKLKDLVGRSVQENLEALRFLTGLELPFLNPMDASPGFTTAKKPFLGRSFWQAFIRGGYQGAVYYIDTKIFHTKTQRHKEI